MRILILVATALAAVGGMSAAPAREGVAITFLANEGVLISDGTKQVMIDGLFERYGPDYATPHDTIQRALASARGPFGAVDVVLVTHRHGDHFHPRPMLSHLRANPRATLVTSQQVIDSLRSFGDVSPNRVLSRTTPQGQRRREVVNGVAIDILGLAHTGGQRHAGVEHLGYIVNLGGRRVLHIGDVQGIEADFEPFRLDTARIDVALVPMWMTVSPEGQAAIQKWIRPRQVVAFHLPEGDTVRGPARVAAALPGTQSFARSMETRRW